MNFRVILYYWTVLPLPNVDEYGRACGNCMQLPVFFVVLHVLACMEFVPKLSVGLGYSFPKESLGFDPQPGMP